MQDNNTANAAGKSDLVLIGSPIIPLRCRSATLPSGGLRRLHCDISCSGAIGAPAGGPLQGRSRPPLQRRSPGSAAEPLRRKTPAAWVVR